DLSPQTLRGYQPGDPYDARKRKITCGIYAPGLRRLQPRGSAAGCRGADGLYGAPGRHPMPFPAGFDGVAALSRPLIWSCPFRPFVRGQLRRILLCQAIHRVSPVRTGGGLAGEPVKVLLPLLLVELPGPKIRYAQIRVDLVQLAACGFQGGGLPFPLALVEPRRGLDHLQHPADKMASSLQEFCPVLIVSRLERPPLVKQPVETLGQYLAELFAAGPVRCP